MDVRAWLLILWLLTLAALVLVGWKARDYRNTALSAMRRVDAISERFTKTDFYAEENRRWRESGERPDVVFLGASITKRWDPEGKLGPLKVAARGVGGQWPSHYLLRFKPDVLDLAPRAVVIKACAISFRPGVDEGGLRDAMLTMLDLAESHGIRPVLATSIPVREDGNVLYGSGGKILDRTVNDAMVPWNDWLRGLAAERDCGLIDFWRAMADERGFLPEALAADDIHPNAAGYDRMTETAGPVLEALLARKEP
ncbi:MAG: hypothetical protein JW819_01850 [Candidatus Krumholzibacteriota bacterium]|nr:hypothetical protein [Candidatus Krumholzibacteriota bacterium]